MTFAAWWAEQYGKTGEVPEEYFDLMRDAYERGKADERERIANLWAGCTTEAEGHGLVDIGLSIREKRLVDVL